MHKCVYFLFLHVHEDMKGQSLQNCVQIEHRMFYVHEWMNVENHIKGPELSLVSQLWRDLVKYEASPNILLPDSGSQLLQRKLWGTSFARYYFLCTKSNIKCRTGREGFCRMVLNLIELVIFRVEEQTKI